MKLGVNYSVLAHRMIHHGRIQVDRIKITTLDKANIEMHQTHPVYMHLPLRVGSGKGDAVQYETNTPADWKRVESLLQQTDTPFLNLHLWPTLKDHPQIPKNSLASEHVEIVTRSLIYDVQVLAKRYGPERIILEHDDDRNQYRLRAAILPAVIRRVVEETRCGLVLDLCHARFAAKTLGLEPRAYVEALPLEQTREIHVSGIHQITGPWYERLVQAKPPSILIEKARGLWLEHLPMTTKDWEFTEWGLGQVRQRAQQEPWLLAFEYGGVGPFWRALLEPQVLVEQIPRFAQLLRATAATTAAR